jgi:protoporphyrinogen/coproporphyrinogen III oxidase
VTEGKRIVVVGGGITGLAAAHAALSRAREVHRHVSVTLVEGGPRFGGNLVTTRVGGFVLDGGPDSWVTSKPEASALARELGLGESLVDTNAAMRRFFIAFRGRLHSVPEGLVLGVPTKIAPLVTTRLFSWAGKARMAMEPLIPVRRDDSVDESIAGFARRRLGREAADRLVAPLLGGISAGDASELSVRSAFPQLVAMEREHGSLVRGMRAAKRAREAAANARGTAASAFVSLAGGVGQLVDALVEKLRGEGADLRLDTPVRSLGRRADAGGWTIEVANGPPLVADEVLLAVPAYAAARLLGGIDRSLEGGFARFQSATTATVFLGYPRSAIVHPLDGVGFVVPRTMERPILAGTWVSSKWAGRAPEGHVLLRVFFGGPSGEEALRDDDAGLVRRAQSELLDFMGIAAEPVLSRVFRFERASAQMRVGHADALREARRMLVASAPGVHVAGGGYDGIGIPDCIRQGRERGVAMVDA